MEHLQQDRPETATPENEVDDTAALAEDLIEDVSIDGMCGVY